ncbi:MAG: DUF1566 domain-containing protein [Moraxella sp.]|nr:DUF1566 domain-containing protein [Moraxella sp.]
MSNTAFAGFSGILGKLNDLVNEINLPSIVTNQEGELSNSNTSSKMTVDGVGDDQYYDEHTGLMWYVCRVGSGGIEELGIAGRICRTYTPDLIALGEVDTEEYIANFINAKNFGGYHDWRLPTVHEVESLRVAHCQKWDGVASGTALTEKGRVQTYRRATRLSLDERGSQIQVDDCASTKVLEDDNGGALRFISQNQPVPSWQVYISDPRYVNDTLIRVRGGSENDQYYAMEIDEVGSTTTGSIFSYVLKGVANPRENMYFLIVRQHAAPKSF